MRLNFFVFVLLISMFLANCQDSPKMGIVLGEKEKVGSNFSIRVTSFEEKTNFAQVLAGAYYVFESRSNNEGVWREIMTIHHDDPVPLLDKWITIVDEHCAYIFMRYQFASTMDDGMNWFFWDLGKVPSLDHAYCVIDKINIAANGHGDMTVKCSDMPTILHTSDHGANWYIE